MSGTSGDSLTRREFVKTAATVAAATVVLPRLARAQTPARPIRIGLVGCGNRGSGAARNALDADPAVRIVALADIFREPIDNCREQLKDRSPVEEKHCFVGFDAYKRILEVDLDYVVLATPPYYRPAHFAACVEAGRNVFMEKPVAVDPVGIRKVLEAGRKADMKGLSVVAGTQRRHHRGYVETVKRLRDGAIGTILAAQCYWNGGQLWYKKHQSGWSDMDWMHRDWVNWCWLSGDHIVEQHVHNLDVINWVLGTHPERVVAMGGRARRVTGDQFDFFSADFTYPGDVHVLSQCRQINGCPRGVNERVVGEKGWSDCCVRISTLEDYKGEKVDKLAPYIQEHTDLVAAIRAEKPLNEAKNVAESTLTAIMARISAYTGKDVTWKEMMASNLTLSPPGYELTEANVRAHVPVPGEPNASAPAGPKPL